MSSIDCWQSLWRISVTNIIVKTFLCPCDYKRIKLSIEYSLIIRLFSPIAHIIANNAAVVTALLESIDLITKNSTLGYTLYG